MKQKANQYCILRTNCLPDPAHPENIKKTSGRFYDAVRSAFGHLANNIADLKTGSASIAVRYEYIPVSDHPQDRLKLYLCGGSHDPKSSDNISAILNNCQPKNFYKFQSCDTFRIDVGKLKSCCDITRRCSVIKPAVEGDLNGFVPSDGYLNIEPFKPSKNNGPIGFVNFLSDIKENILVDIVIEPIDIGGVISAHNDYLCRLKQVNRSPDISGGFFNNNFSANDGLSGPAVKRIHINDPLSDGIYRDQLRLSRQMSSQRHLRFYIRVFAETENTAAAVASVLAETVFDDGSYQLVRSSASGGSLETTLKDIAAPKVTITDKQFKFTGSFADYDKLLKLGNIASADQLESIFTLPTALPHSSPKTILKDTDPPAVRPADMIVIGRDCEFDCCVYRGIPRDALTKHVLDCGQTGGGKTTAAFLFLFQLSGFSIEELLL